VYDRYTRAEVNESPLAEGLLRFARAAELRSKNSQNALNMSVVAIAYIETGKRWARLGTLSKIAKALKVNISDLFQGL
jgi:transcriptional regulator with XRE-family HTH domain